MTARAVRDRALKDRATTFAETMTGTVRLAGQPEDRPVRVDLRVWADTVVLPHRTTRATVSGRIRIRGYADDHQVTGELEISPLARRRIDYRLRFRADGREFTLRGWKSVSPRSPWTSMTVLPFTVSEDGVPCGEGTLRFPLRELVPFLASWRHPVPGRGEPHLRSRWDGKPGRTEVWYTTLTDPADGTGVWLHHELTVPTDGTPAHAHGWVSVFPAQGPVEHARFGPRPWPGPPSGFAADGVEARAGTLRGKAGPFEWDLTEHPEGAPLHTFPRWAWRRPLLPAAHMLPAARSRYSGTITHPGGELRLDGAPGATARIYGHGNARRWAWLHADLGGGDVLEIVAAVSMRPGLGRLPPLVFLRLRKDGRDWPRGGTRSAVGLAGLGRFRARIGLPQWEVSGWAGLRRVRVTVVQPEERTLALTYTDPDGSRAVCRNSETADAHIVLQRWWGRWRTEAGWRLEGTAHAEVGSR
ncbi:hypothetical protein [Streptomyces sp. NPDC053367]|uniref:hypothetical protein n=1 Tax=Streptomyces sp. NPDC053367 TaxID=3365700 RepID=UPI0037D6BBA3